MITVTGQIGKHIGDRHLGINRRDVLRVGGSGLLGLSLGSMLQLRGASAASGTSGIGRRPGWGQAKSLIMLYLQGGPSHIDLWDPKESAPENVRSVFKPIATKTPGIQITEVLPRVAQVTDKLTLIRSMSYAPAGLFNHTAAIYQLMTGYTTDKVSASGLLEPPSPKDFPNFGSNIIRLQPSSVPMLPFVMLPRPIQEGNVSGKGGTAGFLGKSFDPYTLYPDGDDMVLDKMDHIKVDDLKLRPEVFTVRLERRARLRRSLDAGMPEIEKAVADYNLDGSYGKALSLILSGRAREAFDLSLEPAHVRNLYGRNAFGQSCLLARRLVEAGTRVVEVIWPKEANGERHSWDHHNGLTQRMKKESAPMLDAALSQILIDLEERGLLKETLVVAIGEFGRSPQRGSNVTGNGSTADGRDHWPYCYTAAVAGAGIARGHVHGESDKTGSAPAKDRVHPAELLATIYHAFGIDPATIVYNHLNQPRELVKADAVTRLFA